MVEGTVAGIFYCHFLVLKVLYLALFQVKNFISTIKEVLQVNAQSAIAVFPFLLGT